MDTTSVEANDLTFECVREGDGDRLALCLHGFPDNAESMAPVQERLADAGFTTFAPYMRGYAPTDASPEDDYSARALRWDDFSLVEFLWGVWSPTWDYPRERIESVKETLGTDDTLEHALAYYRQIVGGGLRSTLSLDPPRVDDEPLLRVPTLLLAGQEDGCMGRELFADAESAFAEGTERRIVTVPGAGHFLHQERPDAVGEEVVAFLTG